MSDKGTLCCVNFFQDVKAATIDNPDLGGGGVKDREEGSQASNPGRQATKHRKKALTSSSLLLTHPLPGTCPPRPDLQTEPN